jgi:hypothetical protein
MRSFESMDDALHVAKEILHGHLDSNLGCGLIAEIARKLNFPSNLEKFVLLAHEQTEHEHVGITAESCVPVILIACRELLTAEQA